MDRERLIVSHRKAQGVTVLNRVEYLTRAHRDHAAMSPDRPETALSNATSVGLPLPSVVSVVVFCLGLTVGFAFT
mgnify:CR=1 FL=1